MMQTGQFSQGNMTGTFQSNQMPMPFMEQRIEQINWQSIHDIDLKQIKKNNDIDTLESYLPHILNSTVDKEEFDMLKHETLLKLIEMLQMSLQYFDYTQDYLENLTHETQDEVLILEKKIKDDENYLKKSKRDIEKAKNEIKIKKEALSKYKNFVRKKPALKCHICTNKFFLNDDYLNSHMRRRHPQQLPLTADHPQFGAIQNLLLAQHLKKEELERDIKGKVRNQNQGKYNQEQYQQQQEQERLWEQQQKILKEQAEQQQEIMRKMEQHMQRYREENQNFQQSINSKIETVAKVNQPPQQQQLQQQQPGNNQNQQQILEQKIQNMKLQQQLQEMQQKMEMLTKQQEEIQKNKLIIDKHPRKQFTNDRGEEFSPINQGNKQQNKFFESNRQSQDLQIKNSERQAYEQFLKQDQQKLNQNLDGDDDKAQQLVGVGQASLKSNTTELKSAEDFMKLNSYIKKQQEELIQGDNLQNNQKQQQIDEEIDDDHDEKYDEDGFVQSENDIEEEKEQFAQKQKTKQQIQVEDDNFIAKKLIQNSESENSQTGLQIDPYKKREDSKQGSQSISALNQIQEKDEFPEDKIGITFNNKVNNNKNYHMGEVSLILNLKTIFQNHL